MHCVVGKAETRVETFTGQVGDFAAVAGVGQAVGDLPGKGMGEGLRVVMTDNDQGVHGRFSKM
ncbi:conserved protein of unknown function [Pseudomonas sp. JV551A1]|nr:conserved protein of unknown function [Pseudomonas sp. JV551A1]